MSSYVILTMTRGDHFAVTRSPINGLPAGQVPVQAWLTVKDRLTDLDAAAIWQKAISAVVQADGQILDLGGGVYELEFLMTPDDTRLLTAGVSYEYDIQIKTDMGSIATGERGAIISREEVTLADT